MRSQIPRILLALPLLVLGTLTGCRGEPSTSERNPLATEGAGGLDPKSGQVLDAMSSKPLGYFWIFDGENLHRDRRARVLIEPGQPKTVRLGAGALELAFGPSSLEEPTWVVLRIDDSGGYISFEFEPDGTMFSPDDPVTMRFYPHVVDPDGIQKWSDFGLYHEVAAGRFELLPTSHTKEPWTDPLSGEVSHVQCLTTSLTHFSKYAALR